MNRHTVPLLSQDAWIQQGDISLSQIQQGNLPAARTVLLTVPTGKRAFTASSFHNGTALAINTNIAEVSYDGGLTWNFLATFNAAANSLTNFNIANIFPSGAMFAVTPTGAGLNVFAYAWIFDDSNPVFGAIKSSGWVNGDNTIYTVPNNKVALTLGQKSFGGNPAGGVPDFANGSGGSRAVSIFIVPKGGAAGIANRILNNAALANQARLNGVGTSWLMYSGDSIVVNTDSNIANQHFNVNLVELDAPTI